MQSLKRSMQKCDFLSSELQRRLSASISRVHFEGLT